MSIFKLSKFFIAILIGFFAISNVNAQPSSCISKKFSMKVSEDMILGDLLNQLSDMCDFSIVAKDTFSRQEIQSHVSGVNIKNMSLTEVFNVLLDEKNLSYEFSKNVLKISSLKTKIFKLDYITSIREGTSVTKASVDSAPVEVGGNSSSSSSSSSNQDAGSANDNLIRTTEKFDFWEKLDIEIKAILNNTSEHIVAPDPVINPNAGLITVTATPSQLKRVEKYIEEVQKRLKKQVIIDVSIISVELNNEYKQGIDWSKFELGFNTYIGGDSNRPSNLGFTNKGNSPSDHWGRTLTAAANLNFSIAGMINFLETNGRSKVISSPKVTTLNNQQALISVGDNVNYAVREQNTENNTGSSTRTETSKQYSVFVGILLNLLPEVSDDNKIMLRINPSLSTFKYPEDNQRSTTTREIAPDTIQKKLSTVVQVNSGDTIILGGLIGQTNGKDNTRVPILADIPIIGGAFKSTRDKVQTTELIFVITPRVVDLNDATNMKQSLKDLGFSKTTYEH